MSRGGRGGGRGGGGGWAGRPKPGTARINGIDLAYDETLDQFMRDRPQPSPLFPPYKVQPMAPLSKEERIQIVRYRALRDRIHEGPLYSVLDDAANPGGGGGGPAALGAGRQRFDPFEGVQTYSQRYTRKRRRLPKLDTRPYVLHFFPPELWSTLDPSHANAGDGGGAGDIKPKRLQIGRQRQKKLGDGIEGGAEDDADALGADEKDDNPAEDGEDELAEADVETDYEDDEEDMDDDDYNAEKYFEEGEGEENEAYNEGPEDMDL